MWIISFDSYFDPMKHYFIVFLSKHFGKEFAMVKSFMQGQKPASGLPGPKEFRFQRNHVFLT